MTYTVRIAKSAEKALEKLSTRNREQILEAISDLSLDPSPVDILSSKVSQIFIE